MGQIISRIWIGRVCIGAVLFFNVQCALAFILFPSRYAAGFELIGAPGEGMVRGMGILFLMWNVPYAVAFSAPIRLRSALYEAIFMQAIGFFGEVILLATFPAGYPAIQISVSRFILFDGGGLGALLLAAWIIHSEINRHVLSGTSAVFPVDKN